MSGAGDQPEKMAEVAGLTTAVADRILALREAGAPIPPEQFRMLIRAARMLLVNGVSWPPSVEHVIMEVAKQIEEAKTASAGAHPKASGDNRS